MPRKESPQGDNKVVLNIGRAAALTAKLGNIEDLRLSDLFGTVWQRQPRAAVVRVLLPLYGASGTFFFFLNPRSRQSPPEYSVFHLFFIFLFFMNIACNDEGERWRERKKECSNVRPPLWVSSGTSAKLKMESQR